MPRSSTTLYNVEVIISARRLNAPNSIVGQGQVPRRRSPKKSKWEYLVKWVGYGSDANSWEPEKNFRRGCKNLIASFWEHVQTGKDDNVNPGFQVDADEKWVEKETKRYCYWQKLNNVNVVKRYRSQSGNRLSRTWEGERFETLPSPNPTVYDADPGHSDSDNAPSVPMRKLHTTVDISNEDHPFAITMPLHKKAERSSSDSVETEVELNEVLVSDFSRGGLQHLKRQNVAIAYEELSSFLSLPEPQLPQTPSLAIPRELQLAEQTLENHVPSESGISTKQRLSFGALALRLPKAISDTVLESKNQRPPSKTPYTSIMPLGFKKGTMPIPSIAFGGYPELQEPTLSSINALPSPYTQDHDVESLQDQSMQDHNTQMETGDEFLEELMLSSFTNVLKPTEECPVEPLHPQLPNSDRLLVPKVPQETWTWSGNVFTDTESSPIFAVTISGGTTAVVDANPSLSEALQDMKDLYFTSFHDAVDFDSILPACQEIYQFAEVGPRTNTDTEYLNLFCAYMAKMHKIVLIPIFVDGLIIGHTIFFHPKTALVTSRLRPPLEIQSLAAALVPCNRSGFQFSENHRNPPKKYLPAQIDMEPLLSNQNLWLRSIKTRPRYHHALRVLEFPRMLHNYFCEDEYERTYSVWYEGGDGTKKRPGMETLALFGILDKCGIKRSHIQDARIVFIHVGAVKHLHKLPGFLDICSTSFPVQLYTYGSHETIARGLWGVREVYPCGGIVTFTPQALLDDLSGVIHRVSQIQRHSMWECYILPPVLGMAVTLYSLREGSDPISDFDSGRSPYTMLLTMIEDGELSIISSPSKYDLSSKKDMRQVWLRKYWTHRPGDSRATFQACLDVFNDEFQGSLPTNWTSAILDKISKDLRCMRTQPVFMEKYRRYVVLDSPRAHQKTREDALEWTSTTKFDFKDDFYPTQE
ncbi:hypothetical protein E4T56_gene13050 [Termitomyces sp. T112]|nr:hypothetical protein E4T56_gene13050 [Termitomyces sp. T112]